ncbi:MAG: tetratricopeptide repeat protein [Deltaproteobacteria bacterium]|nr:tetratricopeptide repeat protein [Deltaproteobacteria bacterium]
MEGARAGLPLLRSKAPGVLLLLALAFCVYAPSLRGAFVSDDVLYVQTSELLEMAPWPALVRLFQQPFFAVGNWAPVHQTLLYVERALFADDPLGYRIANVLLLVACAEALRHTAIRGGVSRRGALLASVLFVAHPAVVEAVAWINQSKTLLALLFGLLALERWLAHLEAPADSRLGAAIGFGALALLAKSAVALLPVVFAVAWWTHARGIRRSQGALAGLGAFAVYVTFVNLQAQAEQGGIVAWFGGSAAATARILPEVLWRYVRMAVVPLDPVFCVQPEAVASWLSARVWLPVLGLAMACAAGLVTIRRDPRAGLAIAWVAAMLLPVVQIVPMTTVYADRYLALALPGMLVVLAEAASRLGGWRTHRRAAIVTAALVVVALAGRSAWQARLWASPIDLFQQSIAAYPSSRHGWTGLGAERHQRGEYAEAAQAYRRALEIDPHDGHVRYLLARVRLEQGDAERALFDLEGALRDGPRHPDAPWMRARVAELRSRAIVPRGDSE